jgi:hypothetical protein
MGAVRKAREFHVRKNLGGRPPHKPTDLQRATVRAMSACGIPHIRIARVVDIHEQTLRTHYRDELDLGMIEANAAVAEALFKLAVGGDTTALIWWTKARMGWQPAAFSAMQLNAAEGSPGGNSYKSDT